MNIDATGGSAMRWLCRQLTAGRILMVAAIVAVLAGLCIGWVTPGSPTVWVLGRGIHLAIFLLDCRSADDAVPRAGIPAITGPSGWEQVRSPDCLNSRCGDRWRRWRSLPSCAGSRRSWLVWSWAFHRPTNAEVAASSRVESDAGSDLQFRTPRSAKTIDGSPSNRDVPRFGLIGGRKSE